MAGEPGGQETIAPTPITERQYSRLGTAGRGMLAEQARRIDVTKPDTELTPTERKVKVAEALRTGKNPETGDQLKDVNLLGGHLLLMPEKFSLPQVDAPDGLCVGGVTQVLPDGSYEIYFAKVNPDGSAGDIVQDPGDVLVTGTIKNTDLVDLQAAAESDALRELFAADSDAQKTFDAYTGSRQEGENFVPPDKIDNLITQTAGDYGISLEEPVSKASAQELQQQVPLDAFIGQKIREIAAEIAQLEEGNPQRDQLIKHHRALVVAALTDGEVGVFYKQAALEGLRKQRIAVGRYTDAQALSQQIGDNMLSPGADGATPLDDAEDALVDFIGGTPTRGRKLRKSKRAEGVTEGQREEWLGKIKKGEIMDVLNDKHFRNLNGANELVMGDTNKELDQQAVEKILNESGLSEEEISRFREFAKKGGKYVGIGLLAILLGLPLMTIMAVHKAASGGMGMNGQS